DDSPPRSPESTMHMRVRPDLTQVVWHYPSTPRLLFEAGATYLVTKQFYDRQEGVTPETIPVADLGTGRRFNAYADGITGRVYTAPESNYTNQSNQRFAVSYVSGSHAFKTGMTMYEA